MKDLIKINYGDYYKFLVSLGMAGVIVILILGIYLNYKEVFILNLWTILFYLIFLFIMFKIILNGILPWKKRQENLDRLLSLEVSEKELNIKSIKLDIKKKELEEESTNLTLKKFGGVDLTGPLKK